MQFRSFSLSLLITVTAFRPVLQAASSLPTGGTFVAGSGNISAQGNILTINQKSMNGIIDWNTFIIGKGSSVSFQNGAGSTLNKVTGTTPSAVLGQLLATGSIYLLNPEGILIGHGATVHTGGDFLATTLSLPNSTFLSNAPFAFTGSSSATVINLGDLTSTGGSIYLIGHTVQNGGSITSPNGTIGLAAGSQVLITDSLNNQKVVVQAPGGDVSNSGFINAAQVELKSNGGNIYALAGNSGGQIQATGTATQDGHIWLIATHGTTNVAGLISATNADGSGGSIETSGENLEISKATIKTGHNGNWLIDPVDLTVDNTAATTIDNALATTNVTLQTTAMGASGAGNQSAGAGDININAPIFWSANTTLTLDAYHGVTVNAPITATGVSGALAILTNDGGTGGYFTVNSPITLASTGSLNINSTAYTLLNSASDLQNLSLAGNYALNADLDMSQLSFTPIGFTSGSNSSPTQFTGILEGLGHTLSGLTVSQPGAQYIGLFSYIGSGASVENLKFAAGSASLDSSSNYVGMLAGENAGSVYNVASSGTVNAGDATTLVGGLIGFNVGSVVGSSATGSVTAGIGANQVGGLIGTSGGTVSMSYATGAVTAGPAASYVGGLVGINWNGGTVQQSYSTGAVTALGTYAEESIGGLAGENQAAITDSYSTGAVTAVMGNDVGGLVGFNSAAGTVATSYSIGAVSGLTAVGGLVGTSVNFSANGIPSSNFWDVTTSGQFASAGAPTGLTTLQWLTLGPVATNLAGWDFTSIWVQGYPYPVLKALPYIVSTVTPGTRQYGASNPTLATASAIDQSGNDASSLLTGNQNLVGVVPNDGVGSYTVLATGQTAPGYQVTYSASSTLTITPALLTGVVSASNKVYDGTVNANGTVILSGVVGSDNISVTGANYSFATKNVANGIVVNQTGGVLTGSNLVDYQLVGISSGAANITPLTLTVGGTTLAANKIYDGTTFASVSGGTLNPIGSDVVTLSQTGSFINPNAGIGKTVTYTNALFGANAGNYVLSSGSGTVTANITPAALFATYVAANKVYDGTTSATASVGTLNGIIGSDSVGVTALFNFVGQNVGTGKTVNVSGLTLTGTAAGNYTLALSESGTANITPALLTGVVLGSNKVYDGTVNATGTVLLSGVVGSDNISVTGANYSFASKNAANGIVVNQTGGVLAGSNLVDYQLAGISSGTANITPAGLFATYVAGNKVYDGTTSATASVGALNGIIGSDSVGLTALFNFANPNAGTGKAVSASDVALTGSAAGNYTLTLAQSGTANITPAQLTYVANTGVSRIYGAGNPLFSGIVTGFVGGDTLANATTGSAIFSSSAGPYSPAGLYSINGSGLTANHGNYLFTQAASNSTALTVIGELNFAIGSFTGLLGQTPTFSATYTGPSISGLNISSLLSGLTYQITPALNGPGTYKVTATSTAPAGFIFNIAPGTYTIVDSSPTTLPSSAPILAPEIPSLFAATESFEPATAPGGSQSDSTSINSATPNSATPGPSLAETRFFSGSKEKSAKFAGGAKP